MRNKLTNLKPKTLLHSTQQVVEMPWSRGNILNPSNNKFGIKFKHERVRQDPP